MHLPLAPTWLRAGGLAAAYLGLLEVARLAVHPQGAPGPLDLLWIALATASLAIAALAPLSLLALPLLMWRRAAAALEALRPRRRVRAALGLALLAAAALCHHLDATLYVRLYLSLHIGLSMATLALATIGFALALPVKAAGPGTGLRSPRALAAVALTAWVLAFGASLAAIVPAPERRFVAVERTTVLSHGLLLMHAWWGVLTPTVAEREAAAVAAAEALVRPSPRQPLAPTPLPGAHIILITVDSMRADSVPAGGAMANLAAEAVSFTRSYAPSCWTIHSMSALLSSRLPSQLPYTMVSVAPSLAMTPHAADDELVTNPANFRKVTPVPWDDPTPTLQGLLQGGGWQTATAIAYIFYLPAAGLTRDFERVAEEPLREHNLDNQGITSAVMTDTALELVRTRDRDRPLLLWLHYMDPHAPYVGHEPETATASDRARYASELRLVDRELGRLIDGLRAEGIWDDAIVVLHADHGEEFREHGGQYHATTLYEEQVRVPLIVRLPPRAGAAAGARHTPVSLLDLMPTLLDLVGAAPSAPTVGRSLAPALFGGEPAPRPVLSECARFGRDRRAVIDGRWKLIWDREVGTLELYDLERDPGERQNLVATEPGVVQRLAPLLETSR